MTDGFWWLLLWGVLAGMDLVTVGQVMVGRPLVAGTVAGLLAGDAAAGAMVGMTLELFALDLLPMGGARYPDYGPAAVAGAATAAGVPGVLGLGPAIFVALAVGYLGEHGVQVVRRANSSDVRRNRAGLDAGDSGCIRRVHLRGMLRDAGRAVVLTLLGLALAAVVRRWLPLSLRGAVLVGTVAVGAALAVAATGALRLSGRGTARAWLAAAAGSAAKQGAPRVGAQQGLDLLLATQPFPFMGPQGHRPVVAQARALQVEHQAFTIPTDPTIGIRNASQPLRILLQRGHDAKAPVHRLEPLIGELRKVPVAGQPVGRQSLEYRALPVAAVVHG